MSETPQPPSMLPPTPPPARPGPATDPGGAVRPHRGGAVLALGIIGLVVCFICGIVAWSMGKKDLREMAEGRMDRSGEGLTNAGRICGMISVILACAGIVIWLIAVVALGTSTMFF